jgi:hypothetical protein
VAQKRGTKILQVPNPIDPLKSSNKEKIVLKAGFVLLGLRKPRTVDWKTFSCLILQSLNLVIHILTSSKQLVYKINEEIHYWTFNWCRSEGDATEDFAWAGGKSSSNTWDLWKYKQMTSTTVCFPKDPSIKHCAGSRWMSYSWTKIKQKYLQKYHYQEKLDQVSSKNNMVFMTAFKWMTKKHISNATIHKA